MVGVLTMAGSRVDVLATPCRDESRLATSIQGARIGTSVHVISPF